MKSAQQVTLAEARRSNSAPGPALRRDSVSGSRGPWDGGTLDISSELGRRPRRTGARWRTGSLRAREEEEIHETLPPGGEGGAWCEPTQLLQGRSSYLTLWLFQGTPRTRARPMLRAPVACPRPPAFCGCSFCVWFVSHRDRTFSQESFFSAHPGKHAASSLLENALLRSLLKNSPFDVYKRGLPAATGAARPTHEHTRPQGRGLSGFGRVFSAKFAGFGRVFSAKSSLFAYP